MSSRRKMIEVFFFASVREELGAKELTLEWEQGNLSDVIEKIIKENGDRYEKALSRESLLFSVNQEMVDKDYPVKSGDEVGFFPPVTGG